MDEKQTLQGEEQTGATGGDDFGTPKKDETIVDKARRERELLEKENERLEKNIKELRDLEADRLLGSTAGIRPEIKVPAEETPQDYAKKVLSGQV